MERNVFPLLWKHHPLWFLYLPQKLCISSGTTAGSRVPAVVTSKLWDCQFLLWTILVITMNVTWCSLHHLQPCSLRHWNTLHPLLCPLTLLLALLALTIWSPSSFRLPSSLTCEILPTIYESSYRLPDVFSCISQTRKLQNWSHSVTPWSETWRRSIVTPLCAKPSLHMRSVDLESQIIMLPSLLRELGVT